MIPEAYITAWRAIAPWSDDAQVEQDLVLSRAVVELFSDGELANLVALRGGTALNKLFVSPGVRYSEDIDLVQTKAGASGPLIDAIRGKLDSWLGKPRRGRAEGGFSLVYRFESEIPPARPLRLKIEVNTREHFTVLGFQTRPMAVANPWLTAKADVVTYQLNELMGTKLRALYQRCKGRDLFDLWLCLDQKLIEPQQVLACFLQYMDQAGRAVTRAEFERNLHEKSIDRGFLTDIKPLLAAGVQYDASAALEAVRTSLVTILPGSPWAGPKHG